MDLPQALSWRNSTTPNYDAESTSSQFASANRRRARLTKRHDNIRAGRKPLTQAEENKLFAKEMQIQMFMRSIGLSRPDAERFWAEHYASPPEESSVDDQCLEQPSETQLTVHRAQVMFSDIEYHEVEVFSSPPLPIQTAHVVIHKSVNVEVNPYLLDGFLVDASIQRPITQYSAVHALSLLMRVYLAFRILTRLVPSQYVCRLPCGQSVCIGRAYSAALPIT